MLLTSQQGQTAPYSGILRWAEGACGVDDEWRTGVDCTEPGCLWAPLLSNTETIEWRKVYVSIPIIRTNRMVKGLSIPIVRNNRIVKVYRYLLSELIGLVKGLLILSSQTIGLVKGKSIPIIRNNRFGFSVPMVYRPNRTVLEMPLDSYLFQR